MLIMTSALRRLAALTVVVAVTALASATAASATPATAYQLTTGHTGVTTDPVAAAPARQWGDQLGGTVSYPLIVGSHVYVTVADSGAQGTSLYALDKRTGTVVWGPIELGGPYDFSGLTEDDGRVFTVNSNGLMESFNAASGAQQWAVQLPGQSLFSSPPTAADGLVYTGGAGEGGTVYAVNQSTGAVVWSAPVANGDHSSPAVSAKGVYVTYACGQSYDFTPLTGALVWQRATSCSGGGGTTPVLAGGRLYVRDHSFPAVLSAASGAVLGPFAASGPAPAVGVGQIDELVGAKLTATSVSTGFREWSFAGDGELDSAPIVAGSTVIIGSGSGELYGLSSASGAVQWKTNVGAGIDAPTEYSESQLTGLATAGGWLLVPAGSTLVAYH